MDKLVYASVLCDITLTVRPELLKIRDLHEFEKIKHTLTEENQRIFLSHPKDAGNFFKRYFTNALPSTDVLVSQHHESPDGRGFPQGMRAEEISPLSLFCSSWQTTSPFIFLRMTSPLWTIF